MGTTIRSKAERGLLLAILLSAFMLIIEIAGGIPSGSLALLPDAVHVLLDLLSLLLSYGAIRMASLPPTDTRTFGWRRADAVISSGISWSLCSHISFLRQSKQKLAAECGGAPKERLSISNSMRHSQGEDSGTPATDDGAPVVAHPPETVLLRRLFLSFLLLGGTAFGGPAILRHMKEFTVKDRRWLREEEFRDGTALCQSLPGATGMQMAAFTGLRVRGLRGALASYVGFGLPAFLLMLLLSVLYARYHDLGGITPLFTGLQIVVVAIIVHAAFTFGKDTLKTPADIVIAAVSALLFGAAVHPLAIILAASMAGIVLVKKTGPHRPQPLASHSWQGAGRKIALLILVVLAAVLLLFLADRNLFDLAVVMLRVDLLAFGGGFGSLPIMFREVVGAKGWLDSKTFMDGIAMGQITPGPIVVTATFVGYLVKGWGGALVATLAIFTPSFLLLITAAPLFDKFKSSPYFSVVTQGIYASFVGLLGFMAIKFGMAVPWDVVKVLFALAALAALLKRLPLPGIVLAGALVSPFIFR